MENDVKTILLGNEYDENLLKELKELLIVEGALMIDKISGIGGSQEFESYDLEIRGFKVLLEIETYIGISITGPIETVDEFARKLKS